MSNSPADEERLDSDPTDELPILLETAVLDPEEHRVLLVVDDEPTGEHTAHYPQPGGEEVASVAALKSDLEQRGAKIAALEQDISRLSARWLDIERHLNAKDTVIADLNAALSNLRRVIDSRNAVERRLTETPDRESQLERAAAEVQQLKRDVDVLEGEVAQRELGRGEALQELARLKEQLSQRAAASSEQSDVTPLREELATLTSYVANRRVWWDELEAQLADVKTALASTQAQLAATAQALAEQRSAQLQRDAEHVAALAAADQRHAAEIAAATEAAVRAASSALPPPSASIEAIAQLEAAVEHKNAELAAERATLSEQSQLLAAAAGERDAALRQLTETRAQLDQVSGDAARIERVLIDKDRTLEARDERIAALQRELDQKLGALQKLNAMDLSLQGLDLKMSERLRRNDAPTDQTNTPALVCLTSEVPRQYAMLKKTMTIGRSSTCDVQILTHFVSREHARLTLARGTVVIEDLGSTNGTFVNAVRVDRQELRHGDLVAVGETQFRFLESLAH